MEMDQTQIDRQTDIDVYSIFYIHLYIYVYIANHDIIPPMLAYKDRLFGIFESSLLASNEYDGLRLNGLKGLKLMILTSNYLTSNEVSDINIFEKEKKMYMKRRKKGVIIDFFLYFYIFPLYNITGWYSYSIF